jgi:hypothetical protein
LNTAGRSPGWNTFAVLGLVVMATWTLVIKYLAPVLYLAAESAAGRTTARVPVMWDFWWVAHLALAWLLWTSHPRARAAALAVSIAEILVVTVKLSTFVSRPDLSFWKLLWLTNKIYVLSFFLCLLALLMKGRVAPARGAIEGARP